MFNSQYSQFSYMIPYQSTQPQIQVMKLILSKESYFQNEELKGEVWIFPPYPIKIQDIILKLRINERWRLEKSPGIDYKDTNDQIIFQLPLQIGKILKNESYYKDLTLSEYKFPFSFRIPINISPSFEFASPEKSCYIRYSVITEFLSPFVKCAYENLIIIKSIAYELNVPLQISNTSNVHKWGLLDKGSTTLSVSYPSTNYKINEQIPLNITVNNSRGKMNVTHCNFSIIKKITFTNKNQKISYPTEKKIYYYKYPIKINVGLVNSFNFSVNVNDEDISNLNLTGIYNPYPNIKNFNILMPSVNALLIKCRYFIHISLSFDSMITDSYRPMIDLPIWITHQSMNEVKNLQRIEDEELKRAIEISKIEYIGSDDSNVNLINNNDFNHLEIIDKDNIIQNINYDYDIIDNVPKNENNYFNPIPFEDNIKQNEIPKENINNYPPINQNNESNENVNYYPYIYENNIPNEHLNNYPILNQNNYPNQNINQNIINENNAHLYMITNANPNQNINNTYNNNNQKSNIKKSEFITLNNTN